MTFSSSQEEYYYLMHYGVAGMKWGVRRARKQAQKENVSGRSKYSTGKHYDEVEKRMKKEKESLNNEYTPRYHKLITEGSKARTSAEQNKVRQANVQLNKSYYKKSAALVKKYENEFNKATLKDIGYKDVAKGADLLKKKKKIIFNIEL